jgi:hypothetical protein
MDDGACADLEDAGSQENACGPHCQNSKKNRRRNTTKGIQSRIVPRFAGLKFGPMFVG